MLKRLIANSIAHRFLGALILWFISATLIFPRLDYPRAIVFDETYFIPTSQKYLNGVFFLEPHPPLAKLFIALGQKWYSPDQPANDFLTVEKIDKDWSADTDITGYRIMSAMFGTFLAPTIFLILCILLGRTLTAFVLALPVAFDNALIVQSRAGLQDSFLMFFTFAAVLGFVIVNRKLDWSFRALGALSIVWGFFSASAGSVKLTGLFVIALAGLYGWRLLWARQIRRIIVFGLVFGAAMTTTYLSYWAIHFSIAQKIIDTQDYGITEEHRQILNGEKQVDPLARFAIQMQDAVAYQRRYEAGVPRLDLSKPDEIGSPWFAWPLGGRAINYRWETPDSQSYRYIYLMGNPVGWLVSLLGVVFGSALVLVDGLMRMLSPERRQWLVAFVLLYWAYMIPMMFIERVMYLYHYFPPLVVGIILFALVGREAKAFSPNVKRVALIGLTLLLVLAFWHYKPLTYYEPLTGPEFRQRMIFPVWDLRCVGC